MKYYAHIDTNGKILGWYNEEIHATKTLDKDNNIILDISKIPTPNIEVSENDYLNIREEKSNAYDEVTKTFIVKDFRTITDIKNAKTNEINTACEKEIISGFKSDALGTSHNYQSEQIDQLNLIGVVTAGQDDYFKCGVEDEDENVVWDYEMHTIAQLQKVLQDGKAVAQGLLQKANKLKALIKSATTVEEVDAITWDMEI